MSDRDAWTDHLTKQQQANSFKANKYGAKKKLVDGVLFDSTREARRYCELKLMEKAGQIEQLQIQVPFELHAGSGGARQVIGKYVADFVYTELVGQDRVPRVEDAKGVRTPLYRWKAKHVRAEYGITIREV